MFGICTSVIRQCVFFTHDDCKYDSGEANVRAVSPSDLFTPRGRVSKKRSGQPSRIAPMSPVNAPAGRPIKAGLTLRAWSSSMRPGSKPTWRRCAAGGRVGSVSKRLRPSGHWKTMTFIAALRYDRISPRGSSTAPSTANSSPSTSRRCWRPPWQRARSSSSTTSAVTRASQPATSSLPGELTCSSCRPTAPTLIRSSRSSPNSNT
jgi:hypothetical protein